MSTTLERRGGVTLLELMLALALTGLVMLVISMAIDLNLRTLDSRRADVERVQLAQAILRHIASDLQNAVIYEPIDLSNAPQMSGATNIAQMGGMDDLLGGDLLGGDLGLGETLSENNIDIEGTVAPSSVPGLFGNQYELQVDVSHLPRVDQYERMFSAAEQMVAVDIPSDVKTVAYYLHSGIGDAAAAGAADMPAVAGTAAAAAPMGSLTGGSGLVRRALDRAVTAWAAQSGTLDTQTTYADMLAPEVNYLEFRYFDGTQWLTEWDSVQLGGLPVAVEITIGIDPAYGMDQASADATRMREIWMSDMSEYLYRLVVRLPTARPLPLDDEFFESGLLEGVGL